MDRPELYLPEKPRKRIGASVLTAWAAGLQLSIRKQNRSIIPVFNALSVPMEFKSPESPETGSARRETGN
ncbi:hypothetical protein ADQ50_24210 [Salmonella enterica subsp. enterica serovar Heidelberg]|nr:hypothetical protein [Salmonella enterica subsp. enterica serovar Heidelberg]